MEQVRFAATLVSLFILAGTSAAELQCTETWRLAAERGFSAPNALHDAATDEPRAIVVGERSKGITCLSLEGSRLWTHPMKPPVSASPAVADVWGDETEEIVGADADGTVVLLTAGGNVLWTARTGARVEADACPAVADLDGDGKPEILVGDTSGTLTCFDNEGRIQWRFTGDGTSMGPVLVAGLYDAPGEEVVVTSHDQHVYVLSARGEWIWDRYFPMDLFPNTTPVAADVDGDRVLELYIGGGLNHFYRLDTATRSLAFEKNTLMHVNGTIAAADVDDDGLDEVVFGMKDGVAWQYGAEGLQWETGFEESVYMGGPVLTDVDGDPGLESVFVSVRGDMKILDTDGSLLLAANPGVQSITTPLAGDFNDDGLLDIVLTDTACIAMFSMGVPFKPAPGNHLVFSANRAHKGRCPAQSSYDLLETPERVPGGEGSLEIEDEPALLTGANTWRIGVANPGNVRLALLAELVHPGGRTSRYVRHAFGPVELETMDFEAGEAGRYAFRAMLLGADGLVRAASEELTLRYDGFSGDRQYLETVLDETEALADAWTQGNAICAEDTIAELRGLRGTLLHLAGEETEQRAQVPALRAEAKRLLALVRAGTALAPSSRFAAWNYSPWAYFDPHSTLPAPEDRLSPLEGTLCREEYESFAVNVTNFSGKSLDVRATCGPVTSPENVSVDPATHVALRRATVVPTLRRRSIADALPPLDPAGLLAIAPFETAQLWVTVNAKGLAPGEYVFPVQLKSVEADPATSTVDIRLRVRELALPRPRPLRFCLWSYEEGPLGAEKDHVLEDLVEHGVTVYFARPPEAECNAGGQLTGELDFTEHDRMVKRYGPHGFLLFLGGHRLSGEPFMSEAWQKAFKVYLNKWVAHMDALGVERSEWALYPYDEPSSPYSKTTQALAALGKVIREADAGVLVYTDPTNGTNQESLDMYKECVDIWCPSTQLLDRNGEVVLATARLYGTEVWNYDACGRSRTLSTLGHYRWWFWYTWNLDMTGAGWWTYAHHGPADRWDGPNETGDYFCTVYDGNGAVIGSKRWEAAREGIEDYEYLWLLREALRSASERGVDSAKLAEARKLLDEAAHAMEHTLRNAGRRIPLTNDSVPLYEAVDSELDALRMRIADMCTELRGL